MSVECERKAQSMGKGQACKAVMFLPCFPLISFHTFGHAPTIQQNIPSLTEYCKSLLSHPFPLDCTLRSLLTLCVLSSYFVLALELSPSLPFLRYHAGYIVLCLYFKYVSCGGGLQLKLLADRQCLQYLLCASLDPFLLKNPGSTPDT